MAVSSLFRRLGTMLDCSRNAVATVESVKRWIDLCADMGYNTRMLYTEDTYERKEPKRPLTRVGKCVTMISDTR